MQLLAHPFAQALLTRTQALGKEGLVLFGSVLLLLMIGAGFVELADDVQEGDTQQVDEWILHSMREPEQLDQPIGPAWLPLAAQDITALGGHTVLTLIVLLSIGFCLLVRRYGFVLLILASTAGGMLINHYAKLFFARTRPDTALHLVDVYTLSFPSGHSLLSAVIYLSLASILATLSNRHSTRIYIIITALLLTGMIGLSRIYLGVHYPSDVVAGWMIGLAWALICWLVAQYVRYRRSLSA